MRSIQTFVGCAVHPAAWLRWCLAAPCLACGVRLPLGDDGAWCTVCQPGVVTLGCRTEPDANQGSLPIAGLLAYGGPVASAIQRIKRCRHLPDLAPIAASLSRLATQVAGPGDRPALVAVPPHLGRLRDRGLHLPDLLTEAMAGQTGWRRPLALARHDTADMRRADRHAVPRFSAFEAGGGRLALLIDDVVTTGQTLQTAANALQAAGWRVAGAVCLADARPHALAGADP